MMRYSKGNHGKSKVDLNCCITSNLDLKCPLHCHWQASHGVCSDRTEKYERNIIMLHSRFMDTDLFISSIRETYFQSDRHVYCVDWWIARSDRHVNCFDWWNMSLI